MARWIIPLSSENQTFGIVLGGVEFRLTVRWNWREEGGWVLDLAQANDGAVLIAGLPLTTGSDLLRPFGYLRIGGALWVRSRSDLPPGPDELGTAAELVFETEDSQ